MHRSRPTPPLPAGVEPLRALSVDRPLRFARLRFLTGLALGAVIFLGWCAIAAVIARWYAPQRRGQVGRHAIERCFGGYMALLRRLGLLDDDLSALASLRGERGLILVANHPTMMDVLPVLGNLEEVCCIMKAELRQNIFLGAGARMAGYIGNDSARIMVRHATEVLRSGTNVLIFPEATRTVRPPVNALSSGFALIAKRAGAPVQALLIETDTPYLRKGWSILRQPPLPIRFRIRPGRRFEAGIEPEQLVRELERHFQAELGAELSATNGPDASGPDANRPDAAEPTRS